MRSVYRYQPNFKKNRSPLKYQSNLIEPVMFPFKRVAVMSLILLVMIFTLVFNRVSILDYSVSYSKLKSENSKIVKNNMDLKVRLQELSCARRITMIAENHLGLMYPQLSQIVIYTNKNKMTHSLYANL